MRLDHQQYRPQKQVASPTPFLTRAVSSREVQPDQFDRRTQGKTWCPPPVHQHQAAHGSQCARNLGVNIIAANDHAEAFLMVETDRAVAFVMDDILLAALVAGSKQPDVYVVSADAFSKASPAVSCCARMIRPSRRCRCCYCCAVPKPEAQRSTTNGSRKKSAKASTSTRRYRRR